MGLNVKERKIYPYLFGTFVVLIFLVWLFLFVSTSNLRAYDRELAEEVNALSLRYNLCSVLESDRFDYEEPIVLILTEDKMIYAFSENSLVDKRSTNTIVSQEKIMEATGVGEQQIGYGYYQGRFVYEIRDANNQLTVWFYDLYTEELLYEYKGDQHE